MSDKKMSREEFRAHSRSMAAARPLIDAQVSSLRDLAGQFDEHDRELADLLRKQAKATTSIYDYVARKFEQN